MAKKEPLYPHVPKGRKMVLEAALADESFASAEIYYCANQDLHPHREILQVFTYEENPKCPFCGGVMTYGRYWR